jgi:hypothetical protein
MKIRKSNLTHKKHGESAKVGKIALLWLIGIPLPIAILIIFLAGCN